MRRALLRVWLGVGVLTSPFLVGCNQGQQTNPSPLSTPPPMIGQRHPQNQSPPAPLAIATGTAPARRTEEPPRLPPSSMAGPVLPDGPEIIPTRLDQTKVTVVSEEVNTPQRVPTFQGGPANDYQALTGKLEAGIEPGTWMLRYASPSDADSHGGRLALVAPQPLLGLHAGQVVRVQGKVVDNGLDKAYQVEQLMPLTDR